MRTKQLLSMASLSALLVSSTSAAIVQGVGQRGSSEFPSANRIATHATDGSGLNGLDHVETPNGTMWLSAAGDATGAFEIDLGAVYSVNSIRVWNYNEGLAGRPDLLQRGVQSANIDLGLTTSNYVTIIPAQTFAQAPGTNSDFSQVINLLGEPARFIRLDILSNYGDPQFVGLSEIQVDATYLSGKRPLPVTISAVSSTIAAPFDRIPEHMIDYGGVFSMTHSITPDSNMWLSAAGDIFPTVTFDLGAVQSLSNMILWNYNESLVGRDDLLNRGIAQADILLSNDGITFTPFLSDVAFAMAPGDNITDFAQNIDLSGANARYVQIAVDQNYGNPQYTGISEVQFFAVPEPSSAAFLAGTPLAMLLTARCRRRCC